MQLDVNKGSRVCERLCAEQVDPDKRRNLELVIAHMRAEARCDVAGVLATLVQQPRSVWLSQLDNPDMNPADSQQVVVDAEGYYLAQGITTVVWPVDVEAGLLIGQEVYEYD